MTTYALIRPDNSIDCIKGNVDPNVQTKAGWRWVPVEETPAPAFIAGLETVSSVRAFSTGKAVLQWTKVRKSLDEQKAAVKAEAQRRIIALTGQRDLLACMIKQSNANMRANELNDKRVSGETLTAEEETEATALRNLAGAIKAIRSASNAVELLDPIPLDYTAASYWPE